MNRTVSKSSGFTLLEIMVVVAIIGVLAALAVPNYARWRDDERVKAAARMAVDAMNLARTEAIRTGDNHIVFFGVDINGTNLPGDTVVRVLQDTNADCDRDAGEAIYDYTADDSVQPGTTATSAHPLDTGNTGNYTTGSTFVQEKAGNPQAWFVLFGPDGIPVRLGDNCDTGITGTGGGAIYITNGRRSYAILLTPLGGTRTSPWEPENAQWL